MDIEKRIEYLEKKLASEKKTDTYEKKPESSVSLPDIDAAPNNVEMVTKDYLKFHFFEWNRPIERNKVVNFILIFDENRFLAEDCVILVDKEFGILDGQHRFLALKESGFPIRYRFSPLTKDEVIAMNSTGSRWKFSDYAFSYSIDKPDYQIYRSFRQKYGFDSRSSQVMLGGTGDLKGDLFKKGVFKVKYYSEAVEIAEKITKIGEFFKDYKSKEFVGALLKLFKQKDFDFNHFLKNVSKNSSALKRQSGQKNYLEMIEGIYNKGLGKEKKKTWKLIL